MDILFIALPGLLLSSISALPVSSLAAWFRAGDAYVWRRDSNHGKTIGTEDIPESYCGAFDCADFVARFVLMAYWQRKAGVERPIH